MSNGGAKSFHRQHGNTLPSGLTQIYPCLAEQLNVTPEIGDIFIYFSRIHNTVSEPSGFLIGNAAGKLGSLVLGL